MGQAKEPTKVVEKDVVTPERQETTISNAAVSRMAGETWLDAAKRATPIIKTTVTPGSVTRERTEVPLTDEEKRVNWILERLNEKKS